MDLGYILRRMWQITWRHKHLWLFGFLVCLGTMATRLSMSAGRWEQPVPGLPPEVQRAVADFTGSPYFVLVVVALALLALAIGVGLALLNALGRAALVDQVRAAEDSGAGSVREGWQAGKRHLWSIFLIRLLLRLPVAVVVLAGALPIIGTAFLIAGQERPEVVIPGILTIEVAIFGCLAPAICLAVLLSIPLSVLQRLAIRACVLERLDVRAGLARAWAMVRERPGPLTVVWAILFGIGICAVVLIGLPLVLIVASLLAAALLTVFVSPLLFVALTLAVELLAWLVAAAAGGVVEAILSAAWTLVYRDLTGMGLTGEGEELTA